MVDEADMTVPDESVRPSETLQREARTGSAFSRLRGRRGGLLFVYLGWVMLFSAITILGFMGWKYWLEDVVVGQQQASAAQEVSLALLPSQEVFPPGGDLRPVAEAPVTVSVPEGEVFAVLHQPKFGAEATRAVAEGTSAAVLDDVASGVGHYPSTQLPGELGNVALAGHRNGEGASFGRNEEYALGDQVVLQTREAWYVYEFVSEEVVSPADVDVLLPVPRIPGQEPVDQMLTLTTCHPQWSAAERLVTYFRLVGWTPPGQPPALVAEIL